MAIPWMAVAALSGLGLQAASAGGLFGGPKLQGQTTDQKMGNWQVRGQQIADFQRSLAQSRANLANQSTNFYNNAYSRFVPLAETQFASRGFSPFGGAYQSALAKEAAKYQDQQMMKLAEVERDDLIQVDNALGQNMASLQGIPTQPSMPSAWQGFSNSLGSNLFDYGMYGMMNQAGSPSSGQRSASGAYNPFDMNSSGGRNTNKLRLGY